jgi:hypothetical protein
MNIVESAICLASVPRGISIIVVLEATTGWHKRALLVIK